MRAIVGIVVALVVAVVAYFAWTTYQIRQAATGPAKEIVSESMAKSGDVWHVSFVSKFDAPVDKVYEIFSHPERSHELAPDNVLKSEVVSEDGNTKTIDLIGKLDILPPGFKVQNLRNQYFEFSLPVGLEYRLWGNDKIQLNVAGTLQPTYLLNHNTYLITTDFENYTKEPSLVRRWNLNTSAEIFLSYKTGGLKWTVGPQFRYQLLSSYVNKYPIHEYLMEYGIKIGVAKTIR